MSHGALIPGAASRVVVGQAPVDWPDAVAAFPGAQGKIGIRWMAGLQAAEQLLQGAVLLAFRDMPGVGAGIALEPRIDTLH
ncbi:hypothetical protein D3C76_1124970 [compost metagenome]